MVNWNLPGEMCARCQQALAFAASFQKSSSHPESPWKELGACRRINSEIWATTDGGDQGIGFSPGFALLALVCTLSAACWC